MIVVNIVTEKGDVQMKLKSKKIALEVRDAFRAKGIKASAQSVNIKELD